MEPLELIIGDSIEWIRRGVQAVSSVDDGSPEYTDIKASDGWALKFVAVGKNGVVSITAAADTDNPDDFKLSATAAVTAAYVAGDYKWQLVATKTTTRYTIAEGWITLTDNIAGRSALYDNRSHAKKVLDAIEAVLETRAAKSEGSISVNGKDITWTKFEDLMRLRITYKHEYESEQATANIAAGLGSGRKIYTRFI
jgi:hypothetical protein